MPLHRPDAWKLALPWGSSFQLSDSSFCSHSGPLTAIVTKFHWSRHLDPCKHTHAPISLSRRLSPPVPPFHTAPAPLTCSLPPSQLTAVVLLCPSWTSSFSWLLVEAPRQEQGPPDLALSVPPTRPQHPGLLPRPPRPRVF